jgi:hypothetical protein
MQHCLSSRQEVECSSHTAIAALQSFRTDSTFLLVAKVGFAMIFNFVTSGTGRAGRKKL